MKRLPDDVSGTMDKIRVLEIIQTIGIGGAETVAFNTAHYLDKSRFEVRALVVGWGKLVERLEQNGYGVDTCTFDKSYNWGLVKTIRALIRKHEIDIVHSHLARMNTYGFVASRLTPAKNVMTVHGLSEFSNFLGRAYYSALGNFSGKIVAVSQNLADRFVAETMVRKSKVMVIPNGIDIDRFRRPVDREKTLTRFGLPTGARIMLAVGNLRPIKGYDFLIESFARIADAEPSLYLMICGNDFWGHQPVLDPIIERYGLFDRVIFTDFVNDIETLYAVADVYALTSVSEGFSLTTVEAMASSAAVVSTDCIGPREIIDDGVDGVIVPRRDPDLFGRAILDLLRDEDRRQGMGRAARRKAEEKYAIEQSVAKFEQLFLSLAGR
jgi:glycosyltransferase involved in cell wall biosynthesis